MYARPAAPTYKRPSVVRAAVRGAVAGSLAWLLIVGAFIVMAIGTVITFIVVVAVVLAHLPADAIPAP